MKTRAQWIDIMISLTVGLAIGILAIRDWPRLYLFGGMGPWNRRR